MIVLSLFDGISAGQVALKRLGANIEQYYASEVDKHAIAITQHNHPDTIQLGDVRKWKEWGIEKPDLLIGGSPCQNLSFAGKQKGLSTKCQKEITSLDEYQVLKESGFEFEGQSYLFWEFIAIREHYKPKYFMLENVKMSKKWEDVFNKAVGVKPVEINSALVSAQNRCRNYWVGEYVPEN